jgi:hypothetical protein
VRFSPGIAPSAEEKTLRSPSYTEINGRGDRI